MNLFNIVLAAFLAAAAGAAEPSFLPPVLPVPTPEQRTWQEGELTMFCHFGVNTFTDREWGEGTEDPAIFNPAKLDCRQWARAAKGAGFKLMILTAKHHDGFCLWPSRFTDHSVKRAAWKNGAGDVVREFTDACRIEGLRVGLYLSPWDRHERSYGTDAYNTHFTNQLTELLTQYGNVDEVWFDGACGEGPNGKRQVYDWKSFYATIRALAPHAVIAIMGPDIRWVGNESGVARVGESSVQNASPEVHGGQPGKIWYPAECDVSIRPGWFYHAKEDTQVKPLSHLLDLYLQSVGRNSVLLVNVPPNREGLFAAPDVQRLQEFGAALRAIFERNVASSSGVTGEPNRPGNAGAARLAIDRNPNTFWAAADGATNGVLTLDLHTPRTFNVVSLREPFWLGERASNYRLEAESFEAQDDWRILARGSVIGARNLLVFPATTARRVRLVIERARGTPAISEFALYRTPLMQKKTSLALSAHKPATASSVHPQGTSFGADKAVDDDAQTRWATADGTKECWLEVDLEKPAAVGRVEISEFAPRITKFALEYRSGTEPWQVAYTGSGAGAHFAQGFPSVRARFVRLHILDATDAPTIWEFGVLPP